MNSYDIAIIGAGPGGSEAALSARRHGLKVALIDKSQAGGTCLNLGCIPTKTLLASAKHYVRMKATDRWGLAAGPLTFNWQAILQRKEEIVRGIRNQLTQQIKQAGVDWVGGCATLLGNQKIEITNPNGKKIIEAKNILLATGSRPGTLFDLIFDSKHIFSSDDILSIEHVPQSLVILGAGAVGVEFASLFQAFGTQVTLLERIDRILPLEDADCARRLETLFSRRGIEIVTSCKVKGIKKKGKGVGVILENGREIEAEAVLLAVGRIRNLENIGLEKLGVCIKKSGALEVDEFLETNVKGVYAMGDILDSPPLAHVASYEAECVISNLISGKPKPVSYRAVPSSVYSDPEVAHVGTVGDIAEENLISVKIPFQAVAKAQIEAETEGFFKMVASRRDGELLQAAAIGAGVSELMPEATLAIQKRLRVQDIAETVHAHPTVSEILLIAAKAIVSKLKAL
ncbi:MAG: dihydrolipoyl dehydrogenase [Candidatus Omnitrophica bacterium]|nr:dihydrolipoyl dehydrogenase [Candidatus Omnitrophota bacterium]